MTKKEIEEAKEKFQRYIFNIDDAINSLEKLVIEKTNQHGKFLNESRESLDILENFLVKVLDKELDIDIPVDMLITRISSYMGEIVRKKLKGRWRLCLDEKNYDFGLPCIKEMEKFDEKFAWCPIQVVLNFQEHRKPNLLSSATYYILEFDR